MKAIAGPELAFCFCFVVVVWGKGFDVCGGGGGVLLLLFSRNVDDD